VPTGRENIRKALVRDRILVVLDDVWPSDETKLPVTMGDLGERCRLLITAREVAEDGSQCHKLECLYPPAAAEVFDAYAQEAAKPEDAAYGEIPEDDRNALIQHCGGLPLALSVLGSMAGEACRDMPNWETFLANARRRLHDNLDVLHFSLHYLWQKKRKLWEAFVLLADLWDPFSHDRAALGCWLDAIFEGKSEEIFRELARRFLLTVIDRDVIIHDLLREAAKGKDDEDSTACQPIQEGYSRLLLKGYRGDFDHQHLATRDDSLEPVSGDPPVRSVALSHVDLGSFQVSPMKAVRLLIALRCRGDLLPDEAQTEGVGKLVCLWISKADFTVLPSLVAFTALRTLYLAHCAGLASLPESVGQLTGLTSLNLSGCVALQSLPESVGRLTGLTSLSLRKCRTLKGLPESIGALAGLTSLDISVCEALKGLPMSVGELAELTSLDLSGCRALRSLPESVGQLTGLTTLHLGKCEELRRLPDTVGQLTRLTSLNLIWCQSLERLPESVGQLTGLTSLNLSRRIDLGRYQVLQSLPESVGQLTGLTSLDLNWYLALQTLPASVGQLTGLTTLSLFSCGALQSVPETVGQLTRLTRLVLSGCGALRSLPESIGQMTGLTSLDLRWCGALQSLPESMGQLTGLTRLDLHGCGALHGASMWWWAAAQGDARGQCNLGVCYENGLGVEKDEARAAELYAKAAERGYATGQCGLGVCYYYGRGVERDEARAAELYAKAAEQGHARAQCNLGVCYKHGTGVERDEARAAELYAKPPTWVT
jgi:Leucine-rich repeat (LRR) protein